jgi:beta-lactamase class A
MESVARCELGDPALVRADAPDASRPAEPHYVAASSRRPTPARDAVGDRGQLGELDAARIEVALVEARSGPIVIAAFTWENVDQRYSPENERRS